jgi:hypothetical protein
MKVEGEPIMKIIHAVARLVRRKYFLGQQIESGKIPEQALGHVNAEKAAIEVALRCMEIVMSYGFAVINKDEEFGGPLLPGQNGPPGHQPGYSGWNAYGKKG